MTNKTDPERIHLGPPRHSFASSNATRTRNGNHERTKTNEEIEQKFSDRRSGTFGGLNGKFGARTDTEANDEERPRRRAGDEDSDSRLRREFEEPRWSTRDGQTEGEKTDEISPRYSRDAQSKAKFDQPWTRRGDEDASRESPAWRRNPRDRENERIDTAPEWVDSVEATEPAKAHTHEDFLQWMESMKNKTSGESKPLQEETQQKEATVPMTGIQPTRIVSDPTTSVDKFFAKFEEQKSGGDNKGGARPTKSRFASIFGAKEEPKPESEAPPTSAISPHPPVELEQPAARTDPDKKANDAAFAKLLEMLNKNNTPTPQPSQPQSTRSPVNIAEFTSARSPDITSQASTQAQTRTPLQSHTPSLSLDQLIESRSPADHAQRGQAKATPQDLLDLLRRTNLEDRQQQHQQSYSHTQEPRMPPPPPGLFGLPVQDQERQGPPLVSTRRENVRSSFEDMMYTGPVYRNEAEYQQPAPRQQRGGLGELLAAMNNTSYTANPQQEPRSAQAQGPINLPPGLQRPVGIDNGPRPPPGWPTSTKQQPQVPPTSSRPMPGYPPQPSLYTQSMYTQNQQPQQPQPQRMPQRKPTNDLNIPPGFGGSIGVPPGFGPSPTYASPTSPDNLNQFGLRGGYGYSNERERLERQQLQQHQQLFPGMYGNGNRGSGGVGLPPGFR